MLRQLTKLRVSDLVSHLVAPKRLSSASSPSLSSSSGGYPVPHLNIPEPIPDWEFLLDPTNRDAIAQNVASRKGIGDIDKCLKLNDRLREAPDNNELRRQLLSEVLKLPNMSHPKVTGYGEDPVLLKSIEWAPKFDLHRVKPFEDVARVLVGLRNEYLNPYCGEKSYYLMYHLAELERALVKYTIDQLSQEFELISVPDILHSDIIERCGMNVKGERNQVYRLDDYYGDYALSGTAEMALAGFFMNKVVPKNTVRKLISVSRCFRAESGTILAEKGIYRVHQFTKVEMFAVTPGDMDISDSTLAHFLELQERLFTNLGLSFRVLDMPPHELGSPASRKFDIEAFFPGRSGLEYGEISSCSNCTDYQSRRLNIRDSDGNFCHTVNGTACAIPRMIMAICEQFQMDNGLVAVPDNLRKYMYNYPLKMEPKEKEDRLVTQFMKSPKNFVNKTKPLK